MTKLKPSTIILSLILIVIIAFGAFFYAGGTLQAQVSCISANAGDHPEAFVSIQNVLQSNSAPQLFSTDPLGDPANYSLLDISISLTNRGIFDAEWLNIQLAGITGDVAVYSLTGDGTDIGARSSGQVNLKLLTRASADSPRSVSIQYYVYGISRTITVDF
ncbi:MAG: hypothetical protein IJA26_02230 [Clostridia bacterium]|nr:hypothetical protein [Clostridia bacterium]